ncbi:hypothetical protein C5167_018375 [Papaver somniferum]|uniref:AAA+ ATPase domain-containing protein n=1 Tax=Papaver somniferum TaxID=3469 RepID=A0A4Y7IQG9_PAPSO|nr:putative disease resistance protein At1g50180 [Papaver somniferum]RZC49952.1 hypothetical protein C5167_018375 [Papaver somniferum]
MADSVVSFAVKKLSDAVISKTIFLHRVSNQVERLCDELVRMRCFLKDADAKEQQGDERVRNWVAEIRNLAYDAEDVIDTFILKVDSSRETKGIKNFLSRKALMVKNLIHLYRVGKEILAIQDRLKAVSDSTVTYGFQVDFGGKETSSSETIQRMNQHPLRNRYPHVEDDDVIGFEEYTMTLITELLKDEEERCVVSIVGVGGLGKTTLAKKLYRHDSVRSRFDCCGWSSISQQLNVKDALGEIARKCMILSDGEFEKIKVMNKEQLIEKIHHYLRDKLYFIVLDDVWKLDHWICLSPAFPTGKRGSKVLLTTRNKEVALQIDPGSLHFEPQILDDDNSWELLRKKAFPKNMTDVNIYPAGLVKLGREMVRKCGGLPLAICALGGLLATKRSEIKQWELVHGDVISYINKGENGDVNGILALSYHDLPSHLKPCFLYLGLFPEDYEIPIKKLIRLWVAEGFIPHTKENLLTRMEDIGEHQYLAELTQRCMIQLVKRFEYLGRSKSVCRVHDLLRELCLSKAKEINFLDIQNDQNHCPPGDIQTSHRVTTDAGKRVRRYELLCQFCVSQNIGNVRHHKIDITKEVSKLVHLRYLNLGNLSGCSVSSSIGNLRNLQTLKLSSYEGNIPETTSKLAQLRHLYCRSLDPKFRIADFLNLQTIGGIQAGNWIRKGCLEKLLNLRKLFIRCTSRLQTDLIVNEMVGKRISISSSPPSSSSSSFYKVYQYQNPIKSLSIYTEEGFPSSIFHSLSCCHNLHKIYLSGKLDIANLQTYPPNLTELYLTGSFFTEDPMATLQHLPELRILNLFMCEYKRKEMICSSKGFPELQYLYIQGDTNIKEWRIDQGGMPHLKGLKLHNFRRLSMLPEGLRFIITLEKLEIVRTPMINESVVEGLGEDWYKIQHIPFITIE